MEKLWKQITPSDFSWEREALEYLRSRLPDHEPYRAWANFEFIAQDGSINEADLLVLTPKGLFLVEIKSHPGEISGDAGSWLWVHNGRRKVFDNPRLLADRKAKKLASLLKGQRSALKAKERIPFINTLVFLSAENVVNKLQGPARLQVCTRKNVMDELSNIDAYWTHKKLNRPTSKTVSRALEEAGIKESLRSRRVGLYELTELLDEADYFQDWLANHSETGIQRRIRIYLTYGKSEEEAQYLQKAAKLEFRLLEGLEHPGILRALDYQQHDHGPALVYEYDASAVRLDHFLIGLDAAQHLDILDALALLRQIAEAVQYAHAQRLYHRGMGVSTYVSHSCLSLDERSAAEEAFSQGDDCVIVATSTLELGIDVGDLDRVIQLDAPSTVSSFLQRIGRTGRRAGTSRNCLFLATKQESFLQAAALMQLWAEGFVEPVQPPPLPMHIFAQQIMGLALQEDGITASDWGAWLGRLPGLSELANGRLEQLIQYMIDTEILHSDQGLLSIGQSGERQFGKKNFMELFSVFLSPPSVKVYYGKQELGEVHQSTFILKEEAPSVLALGGRSWQTKYIDWPRRKAYVEPTELRGKSQWLSSGQPLHFHLCQAVARVLARNDTPVTFSKRASELMETLREEYDWVEPCKTFLISYEEDTVVWWTFAGKLINASMAEALAGEAKKVVSDNLSISFTGTVDLASLKAAISSVVFSESAELVFPLDEDFIAELKFGECLPQSYRDEELAARYDYSGQFKLLSSYPMISMRVR